MRILLAVIGAIALIGPLAEVGPPAVASPRAAAIPRAAISLHVASIAFGQETASEPQFRAYWVDSFGPGLYTTAEIDQLVADARAANLNAIIAQVTRRADCLCNRSIMPRTEAGIDPAPFDPLQALIDKGHAAGLEVHAWINAGIMWAPDTPPRDRSHVFHTHGPTASEAENWVMRRYDGAIRGGNLYFFDPGHPAAAEYIVNMALSIIRTYDVDGVNLDYIRYPDYNPAENVPAWGYNLVALSRFRALTGRTDLPAPADPEWTAWRREQITGIVRRIYIEAAAINPLVRISADTITYGDITETDGGWTQSRPYREVLQDWPAWMAEGVLDLNIPMNYRRQGPPAPGQRPMFEVWNAFTQDRQFGRQAAIGTALYLNTVDDTIAQIRKVLVRNPNGRSAAGWVGFSYRTPDIFVNQRSRLAEAARVELARALTTSPMQYILGEYDVPRRPVFPTPAPVPPMPWKLTPTTGHVRGAVVRQDGTPADQVAVGLYDLDGRLIASHLTTGAGWIGFVDVLPGRYTLRAIGSSDGASAAVVNVTAGQIAPFALVLGR